MCYFHRHIVTQILSEQGPDDRIENIHLHLENLKTDLVAGKVIFSKLLICLTKSIGETKLCKLIL